MHILLTCAGRRSYLVHYFKEALALLGLEGQVIAADSSPLAPALTAADSHVMVPPVNAPEYIPKLLQICKMNRINLLISLNDLELPYLAAARAQFKDIGTTAVVSPPQIIDTCFDKFKTYQFCLDIGLDAPQTFTDIDQAVVALETSQMTFPVILKPRWGSASIGIEQADNMEELSIIHTLLRKRILRSILSAPSAQDLDHCILIQEKLVGQEYGLDVINDLQGNHQGVIVKKKLAMRAGETDRAVTIAEPALVDVGTRIGRALKHVGNLDCDVFWDGTRASVLELNPRFGGGYPFSQIAGANLPAALLAWTAGRPTDPAWFSATPNVASSKYDQLAIIKN